MTYSDMWRFVPNLRLHEAAALWCGIEPPTSPALTPFGVPDYMATLRALSSAIDSGELPAEVTAAGKHYGDHSKTQIAREHLKRWAQSRGMFPRFLFDVIAPQEAADEKEPGPMREATGGTSPKRRGRPQEHDWDGALVEMFRIAVQEGLPPKAAEMADKVLQWFNDNSEKEPARSGVTDRVGAIYRGLKARGVLDAEGKSPDMTIRK